LLRAASTKIDPRSSLFILNDRRLCFDGFIFLEVRFPPFLGGAWFLLFGPGWLSLHLRLLLVCCRNLFFVCAPRPQTPHGQSKADRQHQQSAAHVNKCRIDTAPICHEGPLNRGQRGQNNGGFLRLAADSRGKYTPIRQAKRKLIRIEMMTRRTFLHRNMGS
jgi:hypothetical protein